MELISFALVSIQIFDCFGVRHTGSTHDWPSLLSPQFPIGVLPSSVKILPRFLNSGTCLGFAPYASLLRSPDLPVPLCSGWGCVSEVVFPSHAQGTGHQEKPFIQRFWVWLAPVVMLFIFII